MSVKLIAVLAVAVLLGSLQLSGCQATLADGTDTWTANVTGSWSNDSNWDEQREPCTNEVASFPTGDYSVYITNNATVSKVILGLPGSTGGPKIRLALGSSIRLYLPSNDPNVPCSGPEATLAPPVIVIDPGQQGSTQDSKSSTLIGAIVGGVIGGLVIIAVVVIFVIRSRRDKADNESSQYPHQNQHQSGSFSDKSGVLTGKSGPTADNNNKTATMTSVASNWDEGNYTVSRSGTAGTDWGNNYATDTITRTNPSFGIEDPHDIYSSIDDDADVSGYPTQAGGQKASGYIDTDLTTYEPYESPAIQIVRTTSVTAQQRNMSPTPAISTLRNDDLAVYTVDDSQKTYESRTYDFASVNQGNNYETLPVTSPENKSNVVDATAATGPYEIPVAQTTNAALDTYEYLPEPEQMEEVTGFSTTLDL